MDCTLPAWYPQHFIKPPGLNWETFQIQFLKSIAKKPQTYEPLELGARIQTTKPLVVEQPALPSEPPVKILTSEIVKCLLL